MTGYHGIVHSVLKRGADGYQVTLGFYPGTEAVTPASTDRGGLTDQLLIYRADITIEDDRTILFPDRGLARCMDTYNCTRETAPAEGLEEEWLVGKIASRICRRIGALLLERNGVAPVMALSTDPEEQTAYK